MRDRLRLLMWTYFALAGVCLLGVFIEGWTALAFLAVALVCAEHSGRIREHLNPTDVEPSNVRPMVSRLDVPKKLELLSGKLAAKGKR